MRLLQNTFIKILAILLVVLGLVVVFLYEPDIPLERLKQKYTNAESKFVEIDGMQVHYRIEGKGTPLVLIHGTSAMLQTWDDWTQILSPFYTVIRMDIPAFGLTGPNKTGVYDEDMYVDFIEKFTRKIGVDTFNLAGNSLGGLIAWKYAAAHPERVKQLVLLDPAGFHTLQTGSAAFAFKYARQFSGMAGLCCKLGTHYIVDKTVVDVFGDTTRSTAQKIAMYTDLNRREGNREAFVQRATYLKSFDEKELAAIKAPTLILWGDKDVLINVGEAEHFKKIPDSKVIIYPNIGHVPQETIPEKSAADVLRFLK